MKWMHTMVDELKQKSLKRRDLTKNQRQIIQGYYDHQKVRVDEKMVELSNDGSNEANARMRVSNKSRRRSEI